jgi:hypothetical protein
MPDAHALGMKYALRIFLTRVTVVQWFTYIPGKYYHEALKHSNKIFRAFAGEKELEQFEELVKILLPPREDLHEALMSQESQELESVMWEYDCWCNYLQAQQAYKEWSKVLGRHGHHEQIQKLSLAKEKVETVLRYPGGWLNPR